MSETMDVKEAFTILKVVCDRTIKQPSKQHLAELTAEIHKMPSQVLQELQEYVLFPLELHLRRPDLGIEPRRYIIDCVKELILCIQVNTLPLFFRLYALVFFQVFDSSKTDMVADVPEELKLSVVECASKLMQQVTVDIIEQLYRITHAPKLSQGIYICVQMMQKERLRSLRVAAIEFIMSAAHVHDGTQVSATILRHQVAEMLMFVLPGILRGLQKVATGDEKQGHLVTVMALRAWSRILVLMMEDSCIYEESPPTKLRIVAKVSEKSVPLVNQVVNINESLDQEQVIKVLESQTRTPEWIADVAQKVALLVESLTLLQQHPHWKVRLELATSYHLILDRCLRNLKSVSMTLVDVLLKLSDDEIELVSYKSNEAIEMLTNKLKEENETPLLEILEENFYNLITKLPRILHGTDDGQQLAELSLLAVYLKLLGADKLPHVLSSVTHLHRLMLTLVQVVELETASVSLLEDCSLRNLEHNKVVGLQRPWKQFKHFMNKDILLKVETICKLLGQLGDLDILCDHLLDLFHSDPWHRRETVLILNEILAGGSRENSEHIVRHVLDSYLEPSTWYVPLSVQENDVTMGQAQSNLVLACLLVEGIGKMALMLGPDFQPFLLRTLYVVVERAGSTHQLLAMAGMMAAEEIAIASSHGSSIASLLAANMDYFSFHVTMKLRRVEQNPGVLDVLSIAMRHSNTEMLPTLQGIVDDVLLQSCDTFQDRHSLSFLQVFHTFFVCIRKWLLDKTNIHEKQTLKTGDENSFSVVDTLVKYHQDKIQCEWKDGEQSAEEMYMEDQSKLAADMNGDSGNEANLENEDESEIKPKVPNYVEMTESILKRCLHFLPSRDKRRKLLALETLQEGVQVLADWENQLLPVVHLIWSPLMGRFEDALDPLILNRSFYLLHTIASLAKDFIRSRTLKNVLPYICQYLSRLADESKRKDSGSVYHFTQAYKLQYQLLDKLGDLAVDLCFQERELYQLLSASSPYLSNLQPPPLQKCCVKLFQTVAAFDQDCVWVEVTSIWNQVTATDNNEFKKNVELLLGSLQ